MDGWDNWDDLRYVVALGEAGSMTGAAKALNTSIATVSRKIQAATDRFGQAIFLKQKDGWELTPSGKTLFDVARNFDSMLTNVNTEAEDAATIRPIMLTSLDFLSRTVMFPHLPLLRSTNPEIELSLHSSNENLSLAYGEADIAVRLARPTTGRLLSRKLGVFQYSIYSVKGGDFDTWVGREEELEWIPELRMANDYFQKKPIVRVDNYKAQLDAMRQLKVATVLPDSMVLGDADIIRVPGAPTVDREAWGVIHESRKNDPAVRATMDWLVECFSAFNCRKREAETAAA